MKTSAAVLFLLFAFGSVLARAQSPPMSGLRSVNGSIQSVTIGGDMAGLQRRKAHITRLTMSPLS